MIDGAVQYLVRDGYSMFLHSTSILCSPSQIVVVLACKFYKKDTCAADISVPVMAVMGPEGPTPIEDVWEYACEDTPK